VILVDTSVWVDHLRRAEPHLFEQLAQGIVMTHPFVIGELACGHLRKRRAVLDDMSNLHSAPMATQQEVLGFVERHALFGRGIGWVDAHLLVSTALAGSTTLWSRDRKLAQVARDLGLGFVPH